LEEEIRKKILKNIEEWFSENPNLKCEISENRKVLKISVPNSLMYIGPNGTVMLIGSISEASVGLGRRLGVPFSHWSRSTGSAFLRSTPSDKFIGEVCTLVSILTIFPDLNLSQFFSDKEVVACSIFSIGEKQYIVDIYMTKDICLMIIEGSKRLITKEIKNMEIIAKLKDPEKAEEVITDVAKEALDEEEEKRKKAKSETVESAGKPTAVYGDAIEGDIIDQNTEE